MSSPRRHDERRQRSTAARFYAVQALFQMEAAGQSADRVQREFEKHGIQFARREVRVRIDGTSEQQAQAAGAAKPTATDGPGGPKPAA